MYKLKLIREKVAGNENVFIHNSKEAYDFLLKNCFRDEDLWRESAFVVFLSGSNQVLGTFPLSFGGPGSTSIDIRTVLKVALDLMAKNIILSHNHPSGNPNPGQHDILRTGQLQRALKVFDIKLLDHVVIGEGRYFSFMDEKLVESAA